MPLRLSLLLIGLAIIAWMMAHRRRHPMRHRHRWARVGLAMGMCGLLAWGLAATEIRPLRARRPPSAHVNICPLGVWRFPAAPQQLAQVLSEGLGRQLKLPASRAVVWMRGSYPTLAHLRIDLTDAVIPKDYDAPRAVAKAPVEDELVVGELRLVGLPLLYQSARMRTELRASQVRLGIERDKHRKPILMLNDAREGHLRVDVKLSEIEALLLTSAQQEGGKYHIEVDAIHLGLAARTPRSLDMDLRLLARGRMGPLSVPAEVHLKGQMHIDDRLEATFEQLRCEGSGVVGSLVGGIVQPFMQRYEGYRLPLNLLTSGDLQVRDIQIQVDDTLHVQARFGSQKK
jgi:hypothetical protein